MPAKEEWRPVLGWEQRYDVSSRGSVRSVGRAGAKSGKILWIELREDGYYRCRLVRAGKRSNQFVHRMVAEAFLGPRPEKLVINHKDGNKTNNDLANLEYVTHRENCRHAQKMGLSPSSRLSRILLSQNLDHSHIALAIAIGATVLGIDLSPEE